MKKYRSEHVKSTGALLEKSKINPKIMIDCSVRVSNTLATQINPKIMIDWSVRVCVRVRVRVCVCVNCIYI